MQNGLNVFFLLTRQPKVGQLLGCFLRGSEASSRTQRPSIQLPRANPRRRLLSRRARRAGSTSGGWCPHPYPIVRENLSQKPLADVSSCLIGQKYVTCFRLNQSLARAMCHLTGLVQSGLMLWGCGVGGGTGSSRRWASQRLQGCPTPKEERGGAAEQRPTGSALVLVIFP